jgi:hypothetical protein
MANNQSRSGQIANYNATKGTRTDGDPSGLEVDQTGNLLTSNGTLASGEDRTNDTQGVTSKKAISAIYSGTPFVNYGTANNANVKPAAAQLYSIDAQNENAAIRYLQIFNLAAAPTDDSSVPVHSFAIPAGTANNPGIRSIGAEFFGEGGLYLSTGLSWGISVDPDVFDNTGVTAGEHQVNGIYI